MSLELLTKNDSTNFIGGIKTFLNLGVNDVKTNTLGVVGGAIVGDVLTCSNANGSAVWSNPSNIAKASAIVYYNSFAVTTVLPSAVATQLTGGLFSGYSSIAGELQTNANGSITYSGGSSKVFGLNFHIIGHCNIASPLYLYVSRNGLQVSGTVIQVYFPTTGANQNTCASFTNFLSLNTGDVINLWATQSSGGAITLTAEDVALVVSSV